MQAHSAMPCMHWASCHHCTPFGVFDSCFYCSHWSLVLMIPWKCGNLVERSISGVFPFTLGEHPKPCGLWSMLSIVSVVHVLCGVHQCIPLHHTVYTEQHYLLTNYTVYCQGLDNEAWQEQTERAQPLFIQSNTISPLITQCQGLGPLGLFLPCLPLSM